MSDFPKFDYPWGLLRVIVDGISILDIPKLELKNIEEATKFIEAYGFDPSDPHDVDLIWEFFDDAVMFMEKSLADPEMPKVPEHLRSRKAVIDVRRLLLLASESTPSADQVYVCGILRLMHILIHLAHDPRLRFFEQVQNQVLNRLDRYIFTDEKTGVTYLGSPEPNQERIKLLFYKKKDHKDRVREIIKLLHKTDSLVEDIYDRIGFRLVTETKMDAVRAVRLMIEKNIVGVPNIRPGRSRNRLVDMKRLNFEIDRIKVHQQKSGESAAYVEKMVKRLEKRIAASRPGRSLFNPHSSEYFRSIQFTCRELVKVKNPLSQIYEKTRAELASVPDGEAILARLYPDPVPPFEYVFFPYEIQIMDVKSYADSIFGKSNHEEYRRKQLTAARNRVMGRSVPKF